MINISHLVLRSLLSLSLQAEPEVPVQKAPSLDVKVCQVDSERVDNYQFGCTGENAWYRFNNEDIDGKKYLVVREDFKPSDLSNPAEDVNRLEALVYHVRDGKLEFVVEETLNVVGSKYISVTENVGEDGSGNYVLTDKRTGETSVCFRNKDGSRGGCNGNLRRQSKRGIRSGEEFRKYSRRFGLLKFRLYDLADESGVKLPPQLD